MDVTAGGSASAPRWAGARSAAVALGRQFGPVLGIGTAALLRHPVWTTDVDEGGGLGVVVVPGFGGADRDMAVLRSWLSRRGYVPIGAGLSLNLGCTADVLALLELRIEEHARATGGPVAVIGHSRGGWLGRLVAVRRPDLVCGLAMLGSPVLDPLDARGFTKKVLGVVLRLSALGVRGLLGRDCVEGACRDTTRAGLAAELPVPAVAVYSREDGVVGWRSCRDPAAEWVEVRSTHSGMGTDPALYEALVPRLASWAAARRTGAAPTPGLPTEGLPAQGPST